MHELAHEFTGRKISPWGGIKFFHKTYVTSGTKSFLSTLDLPQPLSNRGYDPVEMVDGFMTSVILGARRLEHSGMIRMDKVIEEIFGWKKGMACASTFSRFLDKFDVDRNDRIFPPLMKYILDQVPIRFMTLDIDSSVITRYGKQECANKGYNPGKRGRPSHNPIMAFSDELKMVVNAWMRTGDSHSITDAIEFFEETFQIVARDNVHHRLSTIKFQCIAIGSYLVKSGRKLKMKLSAEGKRRHFLEHLIENLEVIRPPYKFSNALFELKFLIHDLG